jgi:Zn-dependent peptidase ImmA (M78 family)
MGSHYKTKVNREAQRVLHQFGYSTPVDVRGIANELGIEICERILDPGVSGTLVIAHGQALIAVNCADAEVRQRFTIAHEIGHYLLHGKSDRVFIDSATVFHRDEVASKGTRLQEIEANGFAAELLMPEDALKAEVRESGVHPHLEEELISQLACRFQVSQIALLIRLTKLGLIVG